MTDLSDAQLAAREMLTHALAPQVLNIGPIADAIDAMIAAHPGLGVGVPGDVAAFEDGTVMTFEDGTPVTFT